MTDLQLDLPHTCKGVPLMHAAIYSDSAQSFFHVVATLDDRGAAHVYTFLKKRGGTKRKRKSFHSKFGWRELVLQSPSHRWSGAYDIMVYVTGALREKILSDKQEGIEWACHKLGYNINAAPILRVYMVEKVFTDAKIDGDFGKYEFSERLYDWCYTGDTPEVEFLLPQAGNDVSPVVAVKRLSKEDWLKAHYPELKELPKWRFPRLAA
jgi:hypothetical protein